MHRLLVAFAPLLAFSFFAAPPSSTNYTLKTFDFGNGGGKTSSSNYILQGLVGGQSGQNASSTNYGVSPGYVAAEIVGEAPQPPTFINTGDTYNKLHLTINMGRKAASTKFATAISSDNFVTTYYVKTDHTLGATLTNANFQTRPNWGGSSGFDILGLAANTNYKAKTIIINNSSYSTAATASTVNPSISFAVTAGGPTAFGTLVPNTITTASNPPNLTISSNAVDGGYVYINDNNGGLKTSTNNFTIPSATADLSIASTGYGAQATSVTQVSGGPLSAVAPYNVSGNNVGAISTTVQPILSTAAPINSGSATVVLKAKADTIAAGTDYIDVLTFVAAMMF